VQALHVYAGPRARERLRERGLSADDVRVIPGAAGGPKGLVLNPLDRFIFGHWLPQSSHPVHLVGASIGAWRLAVACKPDPDAALAELADEYVQQTFEHAPGRPPTARHVSDVFQRTIEKRLVAFADTVLKHPRYRLHVFTSRGRHLLGRQGRLRTPVGYLGAFVANAASRSALGLWLERVVFADTREALPFPLHDYRSTRVDLTAGNLGAAILASCSIPFVLEAVHDIAGAPPGAYWDGGITDYHLHLDYAAMTDGLVLYPHFQAHAVPGWLDKAWTRRHRASPRLANVVLLAPNPEWVRSLPGAKLPDRNDFKAFGDDDAGRIRRWRAALAESRRLADEFAELVTSGRPFDARPLP
jgi:hypothetical protein